MKSSYRLLTPLVLLAGTACGDPPVRIREGAGTATSTHDHAPAHGSGQPLNFAPQDGWVTEAPSNAMRKVQYRLPGGEGADGDATLAVFSFAGGGSVDGNFTRWCQQFVQPDGRPSSEVATRALEERDGARFHTIDVSGRYVAETQPGSGTRVDRPQQRLLGCVIETSAGMFFVKVVGPEQTVARWEASYHAFLKALT
jgi:hypothetical protein